MFVETGNKMILEFFFRVLIGLRDFFTVLGQFRSFKPFQQSFSLGIFRWIHAEKVMEFMLIIGDKPVVFFLAGFSMGSKSF